MPASVATVRDTVRERPTSPLPAAVSGLAQLPATVRSAGQLSRAEDDLPVDAALRPLLPSGGLRRGSSVVVSGSVGLLMALLAEPSRNDRWAAVVGIPAWGVLAASEAGIQAHQVALVPAPGGDAAGVLAALIDGMDIVVVGRACRLSDSQRSRLSARARHKGCVVLACDHWPGAESRLECRGGQWSGTGAGHGRLRCRRVRVRGGRRGLPGGQVELLLPAADGGSAPDFSSASAVEPVPTGPAGLSSDGEPTGGGAAAVSIAFGRAG